MANDRNCLLEKSLSCLHIAFLAQHGINEIALVVNRSIQITPFPMHFDVGLIDVPGFPGLPLPPDAQLVLYQRRKPRFPVSDGFVRERKSTR